AHNVARGPGNFADDHALGLGQAIDEGALTGVAAADDSQLHRYVEAGVRLVGLRQAQADQLEQVVPAPVLLGTDADEFAAAKLIELGSLWLQLRRIALIGDQDDRLGDVAKPAGHLLVERHETAAGVYDEEDDAGL